MKKTFLVLIVCFVLPCCALGVKDAAQRDKPKTPRIPAPVEEDVRSKGLIRNLQALSDRKDYAGIVKLYETRKPEFADRESLKYLLEAFFSEGRYEDAIKTGDLIASKYGEKPDSRVLMMTGISYYKTGFAEAARKNLTKARELGEKDELVATALAELYMARGHYLQALDAAMDLGGAPGEYTQGVVYYREKNFGRAVEKFDKAGSYRDAPRLKALSMYHSGDTAGLQQLYVAGKVAKYPDVCVLLATVQLEKGSPGEARDTLEQVLRDHGDYPPALRNLGMIYELYLGDPDKARNLYTRYLRKVNDEEVKNWLGRL